MVWIKFLICFVIILLGGTKAARYADIIAEKTGLGRVWIGLVLLGFVSSMPELVTGASAVSLVKLPDLAMGTILGSCIFNLLILALLDVLYRGVPILSAARKSHISSAALGIILMVLTGLSILAGEKISGFRLGWAGIPSIIVFLLYLLGMWVTFRYERNRRPASSPDSLPQYDESSMNRIWWKFGVAAASVIGAGIWLALIGNEIAEVTGLGASFVGSLLLAIITSVPEIVICITALRLGAIDMAVADVLGANMINIAKIFVIDLFYTQGSLLASISNVHLTTSLVVVAMSLTAILGLLFRQQRKTFIFISWYGVLLIGLYIFGAYALFKDIALM